MPQWWCTHRVWPPAWFKQQSSLDVGVRSLSAILWPIHPVTTGHWSLPNTSGLPPHLCLEWENQWCTSAVRHACVPCSLNTAQNKFELIQCSVTVLITMNFEYELAICLSFGQSAYFYLHTCHLVCYTVASIQGYCKTIHSCSFFLCICYKYKDKKIKCPLQYSQECFCYSLTLSDMSGRVWWLTLAIALNGHFHVTDIIPRYIFNMIIARHTKSTVSHRPTSSYSWWPSVALVGLLNRWRSPSVWEITVIDWWAKWISAQDKKQKWGKKANDTWNEATEDQLKLSKWWKW